LKIVMVAGYYPPDIKGGGEISSQILAEILTAAGCEVRVLTCGKQESDETVNGISVRRIVSPNLFWDFHAQRSKPERIVWHVLENFNLRTRRRVREFIQETQPDLLLTSTIENFGADAWVAAREAGVPSVHMLRSYYAFCYRGNAVRDNVNCAGQCADCSLFSLGRKKASESVDGVLGISNYILDRHRSHGFFTNSASVVIPEPISKELFSTKGAPGRPLRFGYLGVISADKGLDSLARAWKPDANRSLSIAGRGKEPYVTQLKKAFSPDVQFAGWVESSAYLNEIDFLIVPSIWNEPFGRIVIEAFAKGVPVIGSRIAGIAENVVDGRNGYSFEPGNSAELEQVIQRCSRLSLDEYRRLSEGARQDVEIYESDKIARDHVEFYQQVIAAQARRYHKIAG
jgi:glycosyltransferase involved in cell wall biosynthesis